MTGRKYALPLVVTLLCVVGACGAAPAGSTLAEIVAKMPAENPAAGQPLIAEVLRLGPAGLKELCGMITPPADVGDAKARYALHGAVLYANRPAAEAERKLVEQALLDALAAAADPDVKAFFIEQVQLVGSEAAAGALGKLLGDERLCEPATQALLAIRGPACLAQLRQAMGGAKGKNLVTIVRALGVLADKDSAGAILPLATSEDATLRHAAWFALAEMGDASAGVVLAKAAAAEGDYERSLGTRCCLRLAERHAELGDKDRCVTICRTLLAARTAPEDAHVRCAALHVLAGAAGEAAADELLAAVRGPNAYVREAALNILAPMKGASVTGKLVGAAGADSPEVREAVVAALGRRGDKAALPAVSAALADAEAMVRAAAMTALAQLDAQGALAPLAAVLKTDNADEVRAAQAVLAWLKAEGFAAALVAALPKASVAGRIAVLDLLAARGAQDQAQPVFEAMSDADPGVRQAAVRAMAAVAAPDDLPRIIRQMLTAGTDGERMELRTLVVQLCRSTEAGAGPVLAALAGMEGQNRAVLLGTLARIGGPKALEAVQADLAKADDAAKDAAVRALADWQGPEAAEQLLKLAREATGEVHRVLALRGLVRVLGLPTDRLAAETAAMFEQALAAAGKPAEKKTVLGGLGKVRTVEALAVAGKCLDDPQLVEEAAAAAVNIACPAGNRDKGLRGPAVKAVLEKVVKLSKNQALAKKAADHLGK